MEGQTSLQRYTLMNRTTLTIVLSEFYALKPTNPGLPYAVPPAMGSPSPFSHDIGLQTTSRLLSSVTY
jgi:hypothetical protein